MAQARLRRASTGPPWPSSSTSSFPLSSLADSSSPSLPSPPSSRATLNSRPLSPPSSVVRRTLFLSALPGAIIHPSSLAPVQEGIYLFRNGVDPYSGGTFRYVRLFCYCALPNAADGSSRHHSVAHIPLSVFHLASSLGDQCRRPTDIC